MRIIIALALVSFCTSIHAAVQTGAENVRAQHQAVNTIDPNTGAAVDKSIAPIQATTSSSKTVWIGASSQESAAAIKQDPNKYADAAAANKKAE